MAFSRDEILKVWDEALGNFDDEPTGSEIDAATAVVCAKLPGVTCDDITSALRSSIAEEERKVAAADRILQMLKTAVGERSNESLPGLPGGPPLRGVDHK
jgi:hypothetical protein